MPHFSSVIYFVVIKWLLVAAEVGMLLLVIANRDDPKFTWQRWVSLAIAVLFCIFVCAHCAGYRSDASDNIQFDKKTAVKVTRLDAIDYSTARYMAARQTVIDYAKSKGWDGTNIFIVGSE